MKKYLSIFIFLLFPFVLVSCNGDANIDNDKKNEHEITEEEKSDDYVFTGVEVPYGTNFQLPEETISAAEDAFTAVKKMRTGVNLGNNLDSTSYDVDSNKDGWIIEYCDGTPKAWETAWGQPVVTRKLINSIKYRGFNAVRVPVTWAEHIDENNGIDEAWMARVKTVVAIVLDEGMYCLLNTHHDGGTGGWVRASTEFYDKYNEKYAAVYTQIANEFKDCGEKLVLCGTNEMIANNNWGDGSKDAITAVNQWNQLFVDTVRATGGNNAKRNLMVGTYCCSASEVNLEGFKKPDDSADGNHLIMEIHCYSPQDFTWDKTDWLPNWTTEWKSDMESSLNQEFNRIKTYADSYNMPVIIGEWGTLGRRFPGTDEKTGKPKWESTSDAEGAKFTNYFISKTYEKGFCCFYWDTAELINRETGAAKSPLMIKGIMDGSSSN